MNRVLVISPHPDDEAIGCGGTLRKHVVEGDQVQVIFLTSGEKGGHGCPPEETRRIRERESEAAAQVLQIDGIEFWREPDGAVQARSSVVRRLVDKLETWRPSVLYVPHPLEKHPDHRAAVRMVRQAVSNSAGKGSRPEVWMYEVWTPMPTMDHIVDITPYIEKKLEAIRVYRSQCDVLRFDDAIQGLNRYRGEMHSWPGGDYAEIFTEMRV
ncbi:MAG: PIG-L family deacetylase [Armatimonadetes bacterium]|nr:PIG-L family deacetylase [Armatimonadota bacterium]